MRTYSPKASEITRAWFVVDAEDAVLGKLASEVAGLLRGKHKPIYAPHVDTGDHVIVVNAAKLDVSLRKGEQKLYHRHSGFPGGLRTRTLDQMIERDSEQVIRLAVKGMLPKGPLGRQMLTKLKVYAGPDHPHAAQQPTARPLTSSRRPG